MTYIQSPVFCTRLRYIVSLAPLDFSELRHGISTKNESSAVWALGPYIMGNPEKLGLRMDKGYQGAYVRYYYNLSNYIFSENLLYTAQFGLNSETGLIFKQTEKAIDDCFTFKAFYSIKNVRLRGGPFTYEKGGVWWSFNETSLNGFSKNSFNVTLNLRNLATTQYFDLAVYAPG